MSVIAQHHLIRSVKSFSPDLANAIKAVGPINLETETHKDLGYFLSHSVIGQQLSKHAAQRIWSRIELAARKRSKLIPDLFHP